MDQVKAFAKVLWEQRFWVLSALGTIIVLITWMSSTSNLESQFETRKDAINTKFSEMANLRQKDVAANNEVLQEEQDQAKRQREFVLAVWKSLYERQREEVLYWPKDALGEPFVNYIENRKFLDSILPDMRDSYSNYIKNRFDGLADIIKALKNPDTGMTGMGGRGMGGEGRGREGRGGYGGEYATMNLPDGEEEQDYLVLWLDQDKVRDQLRFDSRPTPTQIWVTQEDLWVYESLLNVIARTNEERGATRPDNTAIRAIVSLDIGRDANMGASNDMGRVMVPRSTESAGGFGDRGYGDGGGEMGPGRPDRGDESGYGRGGEVFGGRDGMDGEGASADSIWLAYRYLDTEGEPVASGDAESFRSTEFRQLPVRMVLMMDQRWIPQFLIESANASLPLEVKQIRINPEKASAASDASGRGMGGFGRGGSRGFGSMDVSSLTSDPSIAQVEFRGAVYIYNEPDPNQLDVPGGEEDENQFAAME